MITEADELTDAELVARYRRDPDLFTVVHDRYHRDVHLYVAGRLDTQIAEDIAAETFLVAFDRRDRFDPVLGELRPWLFGIATNLIARHRRKETRHYRALGIAVGTVGSRLSRARAKILTLIDKEKVRG
ncbi:RNA polymerase sigma factor [Streptosporangium sp. NPDC049376]|uniref:RNA polymerase sigma factor n=1 Tax=Streptosporangium sp. NPDC049376 TaxID=3366192 RepID=UPI00378B6E6E